MTTLKIALFALLLTLAICIGRRLSSFFEWRYTRANHRRQQIHVSLPKPLASGFPRKKPAWAERAVLALHEQTGLSHRKLANLFNHMYFAATGMSVGRTWVRELLKKHAYEALHRQRALKHCVPEPQPRNRMWGVDTTCVADAEGNMHITLGIVDHGSRLNIALRRMRRFNAWTLLGMLFLAFGEYGMPRMLKLDNHPVHHAKWLQCALRWTGVRLRFTQPASPWQNGRIERLFGTFKKCLREFVMRDAKHLDQSLARFRFWYNAARPHQHLEGCTPLQAWHGVDPYRTTPKEALWFEAWDNRLRGWVLRH